MPRGEFQIFFVFLQFALPSFLYVQTPRLFVSLRSLQSFLPVCVPFYVHLSLFIRPVFIFQGVYFTPSFEFCAEQVIFENVRMPNFESKILCFWNILSQTKSQTFRFKGGIISNRVVFYFQRMRGDEPKRRGAMLCLVLRQWISFILFLLQFFLPFLFLSPLCRTPCSSYDQYCTHIHSNI